MLSSGKPKAIDLLYWLFHGGPSVAVLTEGGYNGGSELTCCLLLTCKVQCLTLASNWAFLFGPMLVDEHIMLIKKSVDLVSINIVAIS